MHLYIVSVSVFLSLSFSLYISITFTLSPLTPHPSSSLPPRTQTYILRTRNASGVYGRGIVSISCCTHAEGGTASENFNRHSHGNKVWLRIELYVDKCDSRHACVVGGFSLRDQWEGSISVLCVQYDWVVSVGVVRVLYHVCNIILFIILQTNKWKDQFQGWLKEWTDFFDVLAERLLQSKSYLASFFFCNVSDVHATPPSLASVSYNLSAQLAWHMWIFLGRQCCISRLNYSRLKLQRCVAT